jgi:hypothetical protein
MLAQLARARDLGGLVKDYATGKLAYSGEADESGCPHGEGKLEFGEAAGAAGGLRLLSYEGSFENGRPMGRGRYTLEVPAGVAGKPVRRVADGEFIGRYPAGDGHIYGVRGRDAKGTVVEVYDGQLGPDFSFHGAGKLKLGAGVHVEGSFAHGQAQGAGCRLWMLQGKRKVVALSSLPCYMGAMHAGTPEPSGELWLPGSAGSPTTIYSGSFDGASVYNYGKPGGHGAILFPNGNIYQGPVMEAAVPEGAFMPVPMAGKLITRAPCTQVQAKQLGPVSADGMVECEYFGDFDARGQPQGEGKLLRASDQEVVHEGQFKDGKPATGWAHWLFG